MRFAMSNAMLSKQTVCITPNKKIAILISVRIASWSPIIYVTQISCDLAFAMALFLSRYQKFCHYVWQKCCHFSHKVRQICVYVEKSNEKKINLKPVQHLCHKRRNIGFFWWYAMRYKEKLTHKTSFFLVLFGLCVSVVSFFLSRFPFQIHVLRLFETFQNVFGSLLLFYFGYFTFFLTTSFQLLFFSFFKATNHRLSLCMPKCCHPTKMKMLKLILSNSYGYFIV